MITARVIDGGKTGMMASLFGFRDHSNDMNIVRDLVGTPFDSVQTNLRESIIQLNTAYMGSETINMGKMITMQHGSVFDPFAMTIINRDNILNSNLRMKEIISSHPEVMKLDRLGFIDGFANVTPDLDLHKWIDDGELNMDGQISYTTYDNAVYDSYDELDKHVIRETWHNIQDMIAEGVDPTSDELRYFD